MNFALIFAGGVGKRMNRPGLPKQFLKVNGIEIIVHTILHFQKNEKIDSIVVVTAKEYTQLMEKLASQYKLDKVVKVVAGGNSGQESIYNGLVAIEPLVKSERDIVLIHDGVRPIIDSKTIDDNIACVLENGTCITTAPATETMLYVDTNMKVVDVLDRDKCLIGRAPQSFYFKDINKCHEEANKLGKHDFKDSAALMQHFGYKMYTINGPINNIKITTPMDFYIFKAILDSSEYQQIDAE